MSSNSGVKFSNKWCINGCGRIRRTERKSDGTCFYICDKCKRKHTRKELEDYWENDN